MYAITSDWVTTYGMGELFMLTQDEDCQLTQSLLMQAIAGEFDDAVNELERAVAARALVRINAALDYARRRINSYIGNRVMLPLTAGQIAETSLKECALALSRCHLMDDTDNSTERTDECCDRWIKWLEQINKGTLTLNIGTQSNASSNRVLSGPLPCSRLTHGYPGGWYGDCDE